ncbi:MAG: DUF6538 domain-containing protein, partial [Hyphomicrobiaceae bacterium]
MNDVAKHPWLMQRGETYYARAAVPKDIVEVFGRTEVKRSLRTKDPKEARRRIIDEAAKISAKFEACKEVQQRIDGATKTPDLPCSKRVPSLPASTLKALCEAHYQHVIDDDFDWRAEIRAKAVDDDEGFRHGKYIAHPTFDWYLFNCGDLDRDQKLVLCFEENLSERIKRLETALLVADCSDHVEAARLALGEHRIVDNPQNVRRLARKLMEAELSAIEAIRAKDRSRYDEIVG